MTAPRPPADRDEPERSQPGLATERTQLAWTRTAIAFAATGAAILKTHVIAGIVVLALGLATWGMQRLIPASGDQPARPRQLLLVTIAVTAVGLVALVIALTARSKGFR
jgi:uncharacterized membrane protein YidH (DUF202 family)